MTPATNEVDETPTYLKPLYDDWYGEVAAPLLFRAINLESWDICNQLLERDRLMICEELEHVDIYGYSALHYACWWNSTPLNVIRQVIDFSPQNFPSQPNRKGRTPLHLAAWRGRDEAVELLANKCPEAASVTDRTQKTPLVDACYRNRSKRVLQALLKADASQIVRKNNLERSPALIFFRISHGLVSAPGLRGFSSEEEREAYAAKVRMVLAAERMMQGKEKRNLDDDRNLLQAAIESPSCPFTYVKYLLDKVESNIPSFRDEQENTLLHLAVKAEPFNFENFFKCDRCNVEIVSGQKVYFNRDPDKAHWGVRCCSTICDRGRHSRRVMGQYNAVPVVCKEFAVVEYILSRFPMLSTVPDICGRLPLQLALESGRTWYAGARELIMANPACLTRQDNGRLYPFQLAAIHKRRPDEGMPPRKRRKLSDAQENNNTAVDREQLCTIFHLLCECPSLVQSIL